MSAAVLSTLATCVRAERWHRILHLIGVDAKRADSYSLTTVGYMGNNVLPARAGEALRVVLHDARTRAGKRALAGTIVAERILDLIVLGAIQPLRMVAKSEVRGWPVIGLLAHRAGTIFVDRERLSTLPAMVAAVAGALAGGAAVGVFPEGTTWCGVARGRFRPAVFQAAVDTVTPVRPVAVRYRLGAAGPTTVAAFVGSATLWEDLVRVASLHRLVAEVHLLPPLLPAPATTRRALATQAETAVTAVASVLGTECSNSGPVECSLSSERSHGGRG